MSAARPGEGTGGARPGQIESGYLWTGRGWVVAPGAGVEPRRGPAVRTRTADGGWAGRSVVVVPAAQGSRHLLVVALVALLLAAAVVVTFSALGLL